MEQLIEKMKDSTERFRGEAAYRYLKEHIMDNGELSVNVKDTDVYDDIRPKGVLDNNMLTGPNAIYVGEFDDPWIKTAMLAFEYGYWVVTKDTDTKHDKPWIIGWDEAQIFLDKIGITLPIHAQEAITVYLPKVSKRHGDRIQRD